MKVIKMSVQEAEQDWKKLLVNAESKNPFVDYPWISTIHLHEDVYSFYVFIAYDDNDEPVMGIPISIPKYKGDYSDILVTKDVDPNLAYQLASVILTQAIQTDFPQGSFFKYDSEFVNINKEMFILDTLKNSWDILLPEKYEDFWGTFRRKKRYNIRRDLRLLEEKYKVDIEVKAKRKMMEEFFRLHERKWGPRWSTGEMRHFLYSYAQALGDKLWLGMMKIDDVPAYMLFCTECDKKMYVNIGGYDERYRKYGIGIITHLAMIEAAISENFTEYDLMKGDSPYKKTLGGIKRNRYIWRFNNV